MSQSRKTFRTAAFAAAGALSMVALAACSGGADKGGAASGDKPEEGAATGEVVNIEYMHRLPDGEGMASVEEITAQWNAENPDIQVKTD